MEDTWDLKSYALRRREGSTPSVSTTIILLLIYLSRRNDCVRYLYDSNPGYNRRKFVPSRPYGNIQWKSTDVSLDINCECGYVSHLDAQCTYYVACPRCARVYMTNGHIELIPLTKDEAEIVKDHVKIGQMYG